MRICAGIVFYNPTDREIENVKTYIDYVDKVIIYDNSEVNNHNYLEESIDKEKLIYLWNGKNDGISKAFNTMADIANSINLDQMLLLDQDSIIEGADIEIIKNNMLNVNDCHFFCLKVIFNGEVPIQSYEYMKLRQVPFAITSGTIINISKFIEVGGYDEKLFIDGVDRDFCLKLKMKGMTIYEFQNIFLKQVLGEGRKNIFGVYEHNCLRNYYIFRNRLYILNKYKEIFRGMSRLKSLYLSSIKQILSVLLCEKNKWCKLKLIYRGYKDYTNNIMGKFED